MKKFLALLITLVLAVAVFAGSIAPPAGWVGQMFASTFALYGTLGKTTHFLCTAEPIERIAGGYRLMTAGHCVQLSPDGLQFSVSEEIGGARTDVRLIKAVLDDSLDFAIFDLQTDKTYTVFPIGNENEIQIGDETVSPNFALGATKQLSFGTVASDLLVPSETCKADEGCTGNFMVQEYAGPGSSGSAVLSVKTHHVIGLNVWEFSDGPIGLGVEPISLFGKFMLAPNQPHPGSKTAFTATIPTETFAAQFGSKHAFKLQAKGPNPTFVQNGYKFQAYTGGFELSDKYYYKSKVFIDMDESGYRLVSKKSKFSVGLTVLGKA